MRPLEMVDEKVNVNLHMQNTGSWQMIFAQGVPEAATEWRQEPTACSDHFPLTVPHEHTFTYIVLIKHFQNPNSKRSFLSHPASSNCHSLHLRCK